MVLALTVGGVLWRGSVKISATNTSVKEQEKKLEKLQSDLVAHKLEVAQKYISMEFFTQIRMEIQTGFRDLGLRMDNIADGRKSV